MLFALFIWIAGVYNPECVGGVDFTTNGNNYFTDAFILSWTTFATVVSARVTLKIQGVDQNRLSECILLTRSTASTLL